jgi:anti-anti-sigma factor
MPILGREPGTQVFRDVLENPDDDLIPGVVVVRLDGGLFFATADALEDRIRGLIQSADVRCVVLDCEGINFLDSQGSATIDDVLVLCRQSEVTLRLARAKPSVRATLEREGTVERLGGDHIHGNVYRAVDAELNR